MVVVYYTTCETRVFLLLCCVVVYNRITIMMTSNGIHFNEDESGQSDLYCYEDSARSVEIVREENKDGQLGSFGFTIFQERPPRIGTVIPGGY